MSTPGIRQRLAPALSGTLKIRAKELASGWAAGAHHAARKGSGIEFAGHRDYSVGDDLRHLDHHALLRHGRLLVRQFHTETDRALHLVVDASPSMHYRSGEPIEAKGQVAESKLERASLIAASLATLAQAGGDAIGLSWLSGSKIRTIPPRRGREALEGLFFELEKICTDESKNSTPNPSSSEPLPSQSLWQTLYGNLGSLLPRGALVVVLSDFLDMNADLARAMSALCTNKRTVRAAQILTAEEINFPFEGAIRLRDPETGREVETDATRVRKRYKHSLGELTEEIKKNLSGRGGMMLRHSTLAPPLDILRALTDGSTRSDR